MSLNRNFGKLSEGEITYAQNAIVSAERVILNPTDEQYLAAGYKPVIDTRPITDADHYAVATGWAETADTITRVYETRESAPVTRRFSKLRLILALKSEGLYAAFKAAIAAADLEDEWQAAQVLDESYPQFTAYRAQMCAALGISDEKCEAILAASVEV